MGSGSVRSSLKAPFLEYWSVSDAVAGLKLEPSPKIHPPVEPISPVSSVSSCGILLPFQYDHAADSIPLTPRQGAGQHLDMAMFYSHSLFIGGLVTHTAPP